MWFPADEGMVNLERVAFIKVGTYQVEFFNDAQAVMTTASFSSEDELRQYLDKLRDEVSYPLSAEDQERLNGPREENLLEVAEDSD